MPVKELVNRAFLMTKMFAVNKIRHSFLAELCSKHLKILKKR